MAAEAYVECRYEDSSALFISELSSNSASELMIAAMAIHDILSANWQRYVDAGQLTASALAAKIRQPRQQAERMAASSEGRYFLAHDYPILGTPDQVRGFARVEAYAPRLWSKLYPNVTDLELRQGSLADAHTARDARTLLFHALHDYKHDRKVAAYVEEPNEDARVFFTGSGFYERRVTGPEVLGAGSEMRYIHFEAAHKQDVYASMPTEHTYSYR